MKKKLILSAVFAFAVVGISPAVGATQPDENGEHKVTICHRTNSVKNPYVQIEVDESAVDGTGPGDHFKRHQGPLASSEAVAQQLKDSHTKWGDIIPPVAPFHDGLNWTAEGQAIYNNNCEFVQPEEPVVPVTPVTPTTVAEAPVNQVAAPKAAPNAGAGGSLGSVVPSVLALFGSIGSLAYGVIRFRSFGL